MATNRWGGYGGTVPDVRKHPTKTLGVLDLIIEYNAERDETRLLFLHKALDLQVVAVVYDKDAWTVDYLEYYGEQAEQQMLRMLRDKINAPPKVAKQPEPKPAPPAMYAVSSSATAPWYLTGTMSKGVVGSTWGPLEKAKLFGTLTELLAFTSRYSNALSEGPLTPRACIVRVDTERIATVL